MNMKTLLPLALLAGLGYWLYSRNKAATVQLAPTQIGGAKAVTVAGAINTNLAPVVTPALVSISTPIPPNPFLGGNPFLNP